MSLNHPNEIQQLKAVATANAIKFFLEHGELMSKPSPRAEAMVDAAKKMHGVGWQTHLAAATGLSQPMLSKIARGDRVLTDEVAKAVSTAFIAEIAKRRQDDRSILAVARMLKKPSQS